MKLRDYTRADLAAILRLNEGELPHVSSVTPPFLQTLAEKALYLRVAEIPGARSGEIAGFLLAFGETADYESLNFQWFKRRYARFAYIDRIVISAEHQRKGLGRLFYDDLAEFSRARQYPLLTCEVNIRPPNPASVLFHKRVGFRQAGTQDTEGGKKTVSLMTRDLGA